MSRTLKHFIHRLTLSQHLQLTGLQDQGPLIESALSVPTTDEAAYGCLQQWLLLQQLLSTPSANVENMAMQRPKQPNIF